MSIAHNILQMKNKNDVVALKNKAQELYERLSVLAFVDEYIDSTPEAEGKQEVLVNKIELAYQGVFAPAEKDDELKKEEKLEQVVEDKIAAIKTNLKAEPTEEILVDKIELALQGVFTDSKDTVEVLESVAEKIVEETIEEVAKAPKKQLTLEEEFKDSVSVDITQDLFQKVEEKSSTKKASLNDTLMQKNIQVGLNDRIAFVKHLFNHSQADFNRVLSQLNSIESEKEAKNFIAKMVKPDYDWSGKEEYEARLIELIERRF